MVRYTTDRARPGLVTFYDIRSGNGVGLFLQARNPHGVTTTTMTAAFDFA